MKRNRATEVAGLAVQRTNSAYGFVAQGSQHDDGGVERMVVGDFVVKIQSKGFKTLPVVFPNFDQLEVGRCEFTAVHGLSAEEVPCFVGVG